MVDLHHHLLHGIDDGSPDLETSVAMAKIAVDGGITHVVCTPHANAQYRFDTQVVISKITELRSAIAAESIPLILGLGCDFHVNYENLRDALANPTKYSVNGMSYLMLELPDFGLSTNLVDVFYRLQVAGLTPILTHPERNATLQGDDSLLCEWLRRGVLVQITAGSIVGHMGKAAQRMAHKLLSARCVHFIATDAHNASNRPPRMTEARNVVAKLYGSNYAEHLCQANPMAVWEGKALQRFEEPTGLYGDERSSSAWWTRLFRQ